MIRRTLGTLTDTDVKERRTITLGTLTGRLEATGEVGGRVWVRVECGGVVAYTRLLVIVWDKGDSPGMGALDLPWGLSHEEVYVLGKGWPVLPNGGRRREGGTPRRDPSIIRVTTLNSQAHDRPDHPTPKPLPLMERLILKTQGAVADPFAGSGSTLVAAKLLGRKAIGVELEERYCEVAARRLAQDTLFGSAS